jgi:hypothetical protein
MDYLRGNATANAVGLFVICRYLSAFVHGCPEDELRGALQVLRTSRNPANESGAVLAASLAIGDGLGLIARDNKSAPWTVDLDLARGLQIDGDCWPWFRSELLHRMTQHALAELETTGEAPDLILGLTWFLQNDPLNPLQWSWNAGPEQSVKSLGFDAIRDVEGWRASRRWALALGLARRSDQSSARVLIPDASTAIRDQLPHLPATASAAEWLSALQARVPVLGAQSLLTQLPRGGPTWDNVPRAVALGLLKLEKADILSLEPSDDASNVLVLGLGNSARQVGRISIRST